MNPVLYDFKRGILRLSVVVAITLFILAGAGLAYMTIQTMVGTKVPYIELVAMSTLDIETGVLDLEGIVFDISTMKELGGVFEYRFTVINISGFKVGAQPVVVWSTRDSVRFSGKLNISKNLGSLIKYNSSEYLYSLQYNITTYLGLKSGEIHYERSNVNRSIYCSTSGGYSFDILGSVETSGAGIFGKASLRFIKFSNSTIKVVIALCTPSAKDSFELYVGEVKTARSQQAFYITTKPPSLDELKNYTLVGTVTNGVNILDVPQNFSKVTQIAFVLIQPSKTLYVQGVVPVMQIIGATPYVVFSLLGQADVFTRFFPILMLYLAYVYIAKPRSQGALEFVLARPVTRLELYLTRLFAGILVVVVASALFYLVAIATIATIMGIVFESYTYIMMYLGIAVSLMAFYSLCYALSAALKGGRYLAVSIFVYIFFTVIIQIIISIVAIFVVKPGPNFVENITKLSYQMAYFSPLGFNEFSKYFTMKYYETKYGVGFTPPGVEDIANPVLVGVSAIAWIVIPALLGWLVFRKANLSS